MRKAAAQSSMSCVNVLRCSAVAAALFRLDVFANSGHFKHQLLMVVPLSSYTSELNMSSMDAKSGRSRKSCGLSDPFMQLKLDQVLEGCYYRVGNTLTHLASLLSMAMMTFASACHLLPTCGLSHVETPCSPP